MQSKGGAGTPSNGWSAANGNGAGDESVSTESEAESSSYRDWSDQGWRTSTTSSPPPRHSLSSSDERPIQPLQQNGHSTTFPTPARNLGYSTSHGSPTAISHRRSTVTRPGLQSSASNLLLDSIAPPSSSSSTGHNHRQSLSHSTILQISETPTTPIGINGTGNGFSNPPSYPEATSSSTYTAYPRARRKSASQHSMSIPPIKHGDTETSPDDIYPPSGLNGIGSHSVKSKRKKSRAGSFSLPFHRRRRLSNAKWSKWYRWISLYLSRHWYAVWGLLTLLGLGLLCGLYLWSQAYELQMEYSFFSHKWIRHEVDNVRPLKGCFNPSNISPFYDLEKHLSPSDHLLNPGISTKRGMTCYDFSATIQHIPNKPLEPLLYHTYWRSDLIPFGERHTATLLAFLATQPLSHSKLILWTNGVETISNNPFIKNFLDKWGEFIEVRAVEMNTLTKGTELEGVLSGTHGGGVFDERAWVDGDAVRLLVLWHYGGVWMDMDQILTRDIHPLTDQEFVTQWDCYDKVDLILNGALMHFRRHSPYLCEAFHIMASSPLPKPNTFTWGSHLYSKLHRRLLASHVKPFSVLPWCFADPRNCRSDIRFPDPFGEDPDHWAGRRWDGRGEVGRSGRELLEEKVGFIWTIHLHNQWTKIFPKGAWMERLVERYKKQVDAIEKYAKIANAAGSSGGVAGTGSRLGSGSAGSVGSGSHVEHDHTVPGHVVEEAGVKGHDEEVLGHYHAAENKHAGRGEI